MANQYGQVNPEKFYAEQQMAQQMMQDQMQNMGHNTGGFGGMVPPEYSQEQNINVIN